MAEHFQTLLKAIAAAPQQPLSALSILSAEEQSQLIQGFEAPLLMESQFKLEENVENTELNNMLAELDGLSDEEVQQLLNDEILT